MGAPPTVIDGSPSERAGKVLAQELPVLARPPPAGTPGAADIDALAQRVWGQTITQ
jgi:hypothetical protein